MPDLDLKIINGLERISEVFKTLLWEKAKVYGISPIQIQIILFVSNHKRELCNVSHLAKEFNLTKATISDAVRVLLKKELLEKDLSPIDNRRFNLLLSKQGEHLLATLSGYAEPVSAELEKISTAEKETLFQAVTKLIYQLNQQGIIQIQRTCFNCRFYQGNKNTQHHCSLLKTDLTSQEIRLDCHEFEKQVDS